MPRTLKRRSDVLNGDENDNANQQASSEDETTNPSHRRQRPRPSTSPSRSPSVPASDTSNPSAPSSHTTHVKKLVRLALSAELSRTPIRRSDISTRVFSNAPSRSFARVFGDAQTLLRDTFGMQMVELPAREKTSLKDRRTQATQTKTSGAASNSSGSRAWVLTSTLPQSYRTPAILRPAKHPSAESESIYTGLYSFIVTLIYLNKGALAEGKLERYLKRVNAETYTPIGSLDKLLLRMSKEGYVEKRRDTSSGEEVVEWVVGPRGRVEVGARGVAGLVERVFKGAGGEANVEGETDADAELTRRLERSLGVKLRGVGEAEVEARAEDRGGEEVPPTQPSTQQR